METRLKRQRQPTRGKGKGSGKKRQMDGEKNRKKRKRKIIITVVLAAIIILLILLFAKGCGAGDLPLLPPEYEEDTSGLGGDESDKDVEVDNNRINLAVMDDYTVNRDFPDFTVAYPSQNHFDIELSFRDREGKELYRTKRIRKGTVVSIPAYGFLEKKTVTLDAVVCVYDPDTWELLNESTTMKIKVTKE